MNVILILVAVYISFKYSICQVVNVTDNGVNEILCQNCLTLSYALHTWTLVDDNEYNVSIHVYKPNSIIYDPTGHVKYNVFNKMNLSIIGEATTEMTTIQCNNTNILFEGRTTGGGILSFESVKFTGCNMNPDRSLLIYNIFSLTMRDFYFIESSGISLTNIENVVIINGTFTGNVVTPNAALAVTYDNATLLSSKQHMVNIIYCVFYSNVESSSYSALAGQSGLIAVAISNLKVTQNIFNVTITKCEFNSNRLSSYGTSAPIVYVSQVRSQTISVSIEECYFFQNFFSFALLFENIYNVNSTVIMSNNTFGSNTDIKSYGILHVTIVNPTPQSNGYFNTFLYAHNYFNQNYGTVMVIKSTGYSEHNIKDFSVTDTRGGINEIQSIVYIKGSINNSTLLTIDRVLFSGNAIANIKAVCHIEGVKMRASNLNFTNNPDPYISGSFTFTPLSLVSVDAMLTGENNFENNRGIYGGALSIREDVPGMAANLHITPNTTIRFYNNYADYGGAIYIDSTSIVETLSSIHGPCNGTVLFKDNHARVAGKSVYIITSTKLKNTSCSNYFISSEISTNPFEFHIGSNNNGSHEIAIFPGQSIELQNVTFLDGYGHPSSCRANVQLYCSNEMGLTSFCEQLESGIQIIGPPSIFLTSTDTNANLDTQLKIAISEDANVTRWNPQLQLNCLEPQSVTKKIGTIFINLKLKMECPLGFVYLPATQTCQCVNLTNNREGFQCSVSKGIACIKKGYWMGLSSLNNQSTVVISKCPYPQCKLSNRPCSIDLEGGYTSLPSDQDDQCMPNRGGTLCSECSSEAYSTFEGTNCVRECKTIYPYITILLAITFQIFIILLILAALRMKVEVGSGYLYGPLLFLAVIGNVPFGYFQHFITLRMVVCTFTSIFLLDLEVFGEIPWCFGQDIDTLMVYAFHYLGPILVWLMLLVIIFVARCRPKLLAVIQDSPIQAMCLLITLSFWSLAKTSVTLLLPVQLGDNIRIAIKPNSKYFQSWHILFVVVSILVLVIVIIPFLIVLGVSQFHKLSRRLRLYRVKPFLDEFQSCFHSKYRWYSIVYFITWILLLFLQNYSLAMETILILVLSLHFILQPYKRQLLNTIDMLILLDLVLILTLLEFQSYTNSTTTQTVIIYILVILPLLYILCGCILIVSLRCLSSNRAKKILSCICCNREDIVLTSSLVSSIDRKTIQHSHVVSVDDCYQEREPLIRTLQDSKYSSD